MSIPPYLLGPNPWATMMAQQQAHAQLAAAQAHAQAAVHAQAAHHAHMQAIAGPPLPQMPKQPEVLSEDKLQEKGRFPIKFYNLKKMFTENMDLVCLLIVYSSKVATTSIKKIRRKKKIWICGCTKRRYATRTHKKDY